MHRRNQQAALHQRPLVAGTVRSECRLYGIINSDDGFGTPSSDEPSARSDPLLTSPALNSSSQSGRPGRACTQPPKRRPRNGGPTPVGGTQGD